VILFIPGIAGLMALARAHDDGRSLVEAILEGLFVAILYVPFSVLCGIKVEPKPRWWKAAGTVVVLVWLGLLPAVVGWLLEYYSSLSDALIVGTVFFAFFAAIGIFGGRERWCKWAAAVCLVAAAGGWIAGLGSLGEACALGLGGAVFFVFLSVLGG
jgi:hypothetical protein